MTESEKTAKKPQPPKGGRRGGTTFPRLNLKQALGYADKLVGKTHTGPQPAKAILPGVFGNAGPEGQVRASALKQYGLLEGPKSGYQATQLAKDIDAAPAEDRAPLLRSAFLNAKLFKQIFDTFHGDSVTKARIRQRAIALKVHPDSADECVTLFVDSCESAGLGTHDNDGIKLVHAGEVVPSAEGKAEVDDSGESPEKPGTESGAAGAAAESPTAETDASAAAGKAADRRNRAGVTVNLNADSSSDPDKLQKQLELLRRFGVI